MPNCKNCLCDPVTKNGLVLSKQPNHYQSREYNFDISPQVKGIVRPIVNLGLEIGGRLLCHVKC